jgi:lysophospholipase L1-like esterase
MDARFVRNVLLKGLALFLVLDLLAAALPADLGRLSLYNRLIPGRQRLPFGEDSSQSYNLSLFDLPAMFASHVLSAGAKPAGEFRVLVIGDSSIWGTLLRPDETLAGQLDAAGLQACGRQVRVYNLGYPTISLMKDLMVLDEAMHYQPDLIVWGTTLEAFPLDKQLSSPIVANNATRIDDLIARYGLPFDPHDPALVQPGFWGSTLIGRRRALADLIRLQLYGVMWGATGIDQSYPADFAPAQTDLETDPAFHGLLPPELDASRLAFPVLEAGLRAAGKVPVLLFNEPMLVSSGKNSDVRYNYFYPRWAYDQYRQQLSEVAKSGGWWYLDLWDLVPAGQFTNSAIHLTPAGESLLADRIAAQILDHPCP